MLKENIILKEMTSIKISYSTSHYKRVPRLPLGIYGKKESEKQIHLPLLPTMTDSVAIYNQFYEVNLCSKV